MALERCQILAFLATTQPEKARSFYCDVLGLRLEEDSPFAMSLRGANGSIRVQKVKSFSPFPFTALGWQVDDIKAKVTELRANGVSFERYEGMLQDELGIWASPSGARVCWFKDPDGNVLSLTQFP